MIENKFFDCSPLIPSFAKFGMIWKLCFLFGLVLITSLFRIVAGSYMDVFCKSPPYHGQSSGIPRWKIQTNKPNAVRKIREAIYQSDSSSLDVIDIVNVFLKD